jgi:hypothetical protein
MPGVNPQLTCAVCNRPVPVGSGYLVRIDLMADPELPAMSAEEIALGNLSAAIASVIEEAKNLSAEDLQDGVHRRFEYRLCPPCHRGFLANPLGLPRQSRIGNN